MEIILFGVGFIGGAIFGTILNIFSGAICGLPALICGIIKKKIGLAIGGMGACIGITVLLGLLSLTGLPFGLLSLPACILIDVLFILLIFLGGGKEKSVEADTDAAVVENAPEVVEADSEVVEAEVAPEVIEEEAIPEVVEAEAIIE